MLNKEGSLDVIETLRSLAKECIEIGVELNEPFELVARIGAVSFMLHWVADGLERELNFAIERGKRLK